MYVNDIQTIVVMVDSPILMFVDHIKIYRHIKTQSDFFKPQSNIRRCTFQIVLFMGPDDGVLQQCAC